MSKNETGMLYHATYQARLPNILKHGLMPNCEKAWTISEPDVIYLDQDKECAYCFAETAEDVLDSVYDSGIVILGIPVDALDAAKLFDDKNSPTGGSYTYQDAISPELLCIVWKD